MLRASTGVVDVAAEIENTPLKPLGATAGRRHLEFALCVCLLLLLLLSGCVCVCVCVKIGLFQRRLAAQIRLVWTRSGDAASVVCV